MGGCTRSRATSCETGRGEPAWQRVLSHPPTRVRVSPAAEVDANAPAADEAVVRAETAAAVWDAVSELPEGHRQVVWLFYVEDEPVSEVARRLGLRPGTVKSRLHHARGRLAGKLGREYGS